MAKLPEPPSPAALATRAPVDVRVLAARTSLWRLYFRGGPNPIAWHELRHFGPTSARFDHHREPPRSQKRGILYAAPSAATCLAEVFQDTRVIDRGRRDPWLAELRLDAEVCLVDLTRRWLTRAGASAAIHSGPRPRARRWARAIYDAFPEIDGLLYSSSMDPGKGAVALFERARRAIPAHPSTHRALADPLLRSPLERAAAEFGYGLV